MTSRVLVTGAGGFVGKALAAYLFAKGLTVRASTRSMDHGTAPQFEHTKTGDLSATTDWLPAVHAVDTLVHCAARVHVMRETEGVPLEAFRAVNVEGTLNLARQAAAAGVKRFVFISSVKVNGEFTKAGQAFTEADVPDPQNAYAQSKHEAEQGLRQLCADSAMELVIIRPPLVYGRGVKANFAALVGAVKSGWPLPLGAVHNQRSFLVLNNLLDFIVTCINHPQAANQTFFVSDGQDLSTTELVYKIGQAVEVPARLLPVPFCVMHAGAKLLGKGDAVQRLYGNLQVDISKARNLLGWAPPMSVDEGLKRAVEGV